MAALDREQLLAAFDEIGRAAVMAGTRLDIAVYGGSALLLASNFRYSTEDVDISAIGNPWPEWLQTAVQEIARKHGWAEDWLNDGVAFHLSGLANQAADHREFGTFPRNSGTPGLLVYVPTADYLLALKIKAIRVNDPVRGDQERLDILNLMEVVGIRTPDEAVALLKRYFPASASSAEKQKFLLKNMRLDGAVDAPKYPR
jgi:hypothetical protein